MNENTKKTLTIVLPVLIALLSFFVFGKYAVSTEFRAETIRSLDDKKSTVLELSAASTAASAAVTLLPGDTATPIAEKLADLSSYFLIVLCAIYPEKYLVTITGFAAFKILIPAACALLLLYALRKKESYRLLARRLALFALATVLIIPASVKVSKLIEDTYQSSIDKTLKEAERTTKEIEKSSKDEGVFSGVVNSVKNGVSNITEKVKNVLNNFIEALAVMIVTSCVIPILVIVFFVWVIKAVLGIDVNLPKKMI